MRKFLVGIGRRAFGASQQHSLSRRWVLLLDVLTLVIAYVLSLAILYFKTFRADVHIGPDGLRLLPLLLVYTGAFLLFKPYSGILRYSGFNDIRKLMYACFSAILCIVVVKRILAGFDKPLAILLFPKITVICYHFLISLVLLLLGRLSVRAFYQEFVRPVQSRISKTVIYGAGDGGLLLSRSLSQDAASPFKIVSFVDDNTQKIHKDLNSVPILSPKEVLNEDYIRKHDIQVLILAIPSLSPERRREIIETGLHLGLKVKSLPYFHSWVEGGQPGRVEDIRIEDLLGREPIVLNDENVSREIRGKVVMVTGAAGSIGSEICRQVMHYRPSVLVMVDQAESPLYDLQFELKESPSAETVRLAFQIADVRDAARLDAVFAKFRPQLVFHAAAYKHVPLMEDFPYEAVRTNVFGSKNVADLSLRHGVQKMLMISTDKAVNPTNVMGAAKRIAEMYVQSREGGTQFVTTRFGNVLGSNGSVVPLFRKQLEKGGPLTITDKRITRYFMTIPEACNLVLQAASIGQGGEIYVFDMGKPVRIFDLAEKMIRLSNHPQVEIREIGLRPGEKLYEELLAGKESTLPTSNNKIFRAKVRPQEAGQVEADLERLSAALDGQDAFAIVAAMKAMVPEFVSNNSVFCSMDKAAETEPIKRNEI